MITECNAREEYVKKISEQRFDAITKRFEEDA